MKRKWVRNYSIRRRLTLLCVLPMLTIIGVMIGFFAWQTKTNEERAWESFQSIAASSGARVESQLAQARNVANTTGYSTSLQEYLLTMTEAQKAERYRLMEQYLKVMAESVECVENLFVRSSRWSIAHADGGLDQFVRALMDYNLWENQLMADAGIITHPWLVPKQREDMMPKRYFMFVMINTQPIAPVAAAQKLSMPLLVGVQIKLENLYDPQREDDQMLQVILYDGKVLTASRAATDAEYALALAAQGETLLPPDFSSEYYIAGSPFAEGQYHLVTMVRKTALMGSMESFWIACVWAVGATGVLIVLLMISILRGIMQPIKQLANDMLAVKLGAREVRPSQAAEMNVLSSGVNNMLFSLEEAKQKEMETREYLLQLELQQSRAEMMAYRSQINPHFFFNTLECMCAMARYFKVEPLERLTVAMSNNFAYSLREKLFVKLEKEIRHVSNYMEIMEIRCPGKYELRISCAEETSDLPVLCLLLQPLVENAISHGFQSYDKNVPCTIDLRTDIIENNGKRLRIRFTDNGRGLSPEELANLNEYLKADRPFEHQHIGLSNIRRRLKLAYGSSSHLRLRARENCFLQIEMIIPIEALEQAMHTMGMDALEDEH